MTRKAATPARKTTAGKPRKTVRKTTRRAARPSTRRLVSPLVVYTIFAAVGLGTWSLSQELRLLALWGVLLIGSLILGGARRSARVSYSMGDIGTGLVFGLVIGLPLAVLFPELLLATARRLFGQARPEQLVLGLALIAPLVEGVYFRGFLQPAAGIPLSAALYGLAAVIYYLPAASSFPVVLLTIAAIMAGLGLIYGAIAARYGLVASVATQAAAALALWILPGLLRPTG